MEPSNADPEIKAERDGALEARLIGLGFDLQESRESKEEGHAGSGGAGSTCGEEQSSISIKDKKAGERQRLQKILLSPKLASHAFWWFPFPADEPGCPGQKPSWGSRLKQHRISSPSALCCPLLSTEGNNTPSLGPEGLLLTSYTLTKELQTFSVKDEIVKYLGFAEQSVANTQPWGDPEGWDGEGGGRGDRDAEHM